MTCVSFCHAKFPFHSRELVIMLASYRSWKTWKVMEVIISISRPGASCNLSEGHGKSWKSNMCLENIKAKR